MRLRNLFVEKQYYKNNLSLAYPVIIANIGQSVVGIVDNIMVGHLGAVELAGASLANVIVMNVMVFGIGIAIGLTPLVGPYYVTRDYRRCANYFQNALSLNGWIGLIIAILMFLFMPLLSHIGQDEAVVAVAKPFFFHLILSIVPFMIFFAFKQFSDGLGNTRISMVITIGCNILNIILNYLLIYGKCGFPEMGATGAAISTLIARSLMPIAFLVYYLTETSYRRYFYLFRRKALKLQTHLKLLKLGLPISTQMVIEMFALSMVALMMGWISAEALAASQIVFSLITMMFMVTDGICVAVTVLISHEVGFRNRGEIVKNYKAGVFMSSVIMFSASMMFMLFGDNIASIFNSDPTVIAIASQLFVVAVFLEVSDGIQATTLGALRGLQDVKYPMVYAAILYSVVNIPIAYLLGFTFGFGGPGIWFGFVISVTLAAILYIRRFIRKVRSLDF